MRYDKYLLSMINKRNVINVIRTKGPINKAEIAKEVELSIPTVMKIVDEFINKSIVRVTGKRKSTGGKRPELLELINDAFFIIGVDVGRSKINIVMMDLDGNVISQRRHKTGDTLPPENLIDLIIGLIQDVIDENCDEQCEILGIGIGFPGLLNVKKGTVLFSPDFDWHNVQLIEPLKMHFGENVVLENSNRAAAMAESWFGAAIDSRYSICVNLGHGIGSAIMEYGELYKGSCGSSGELGHIVLKENGPECDCGNNGCLEALSSGNAIAKKAKELVRENPDSAIMELAQNNIENIDAKIVFDAAKNNDPLASEIVTEAVTYIGIGLASYINLLDPDMIILFGGMVNSGNILLDNIKETTKKYQMNFAGRKVKIVVSELGNNSTAIGAACLILKNFIEEGGNVTSVIKINAR